MSGEHVVQYAVLEYRHDAATGEHLNIGLALLDPEGRFFKFRIDSNYGRIKQTFPSADGEGFRRYAGQLRTAFDALEETIASQQSEWLGSADLGRLLGAVLPPDDSTIRFGMARTAIAKDPQVLFEGLFSRLVTLYLKSSIRASRTDDEVWDTFKRPLQERRILSQMTSYTVRTIYEDFVYEHAIKNGRWHCVQPISLDLQQATSIQRKAKEHLAEAWMIASVESPPKLHWLVGAPRSEEVDVRGAYAKALVLLRDGAARYDAVVHVEDQADAFARIMAGLIETHANEE